MMAIAPVETDRAPVTNGAPPVHLPGLELAVRFERDAIPGDGEAPGKSARFYELRVEASHQLTFDGSAAGFRLVVTKGAIGRHSSTRVETFPELRAAVERFGQFACERRRRGYREIRT